MRVPPRDASGFLQTPLSKAPRHYAEALRFAFSRRGTSDKVLAFYVQVAALMRLPDAGRLAGNNLPHAVYKDEGCVKDRVLLSGVCNAACGPKFG